MKLFKKRIDWSDFILEILTIIIGISIAFGVENWRQEKEDKELELKWLTELKNDLIDNKDKLEHLMDVDSAKIAGIKTFIYKIYESDSDQVHISSGVELSWTWLDVFDPSSTTFEVIKSSGNTRVFQNQEILLDLYRLHDNFDHFEVVTNYHKDEIGKWVDPILYKYMNTEKLMDANKSFKVNRKEIAALPMLRNQAFLFRFSYKDQIKGGTGIIEKIDELLDKIENQINEMKK